MERFNVAFRGASAGRSGITVLEYLAHALGRMLDVSLRPCFSRWIGTDIFFDSDQLITNRIAIADGHEVHVARPARRNDRLADRHGVGNGQPSPFGAV